MIKINLALQGGGAHGAFTWGVLDRILEDDDIEIAAISGTSAGALNAAGLKAGMVKDGREGAREALGQGRCCAARWLYPVVEHVVTFKSGLGRCAGEISGLCGDRYDAAHDVALCFRLTDEKSVGRHFEPAGFCQCLPSLRPRDPYLCDQCQVG